MALALTKRVSIEFSEVKRASELTFLTDGDYKYSSVNMAIDTYGYSSLAIDRFGIGNSSIADPLSIVQAPATMSVAM